MLIDGKLVDGEAGIFPNVNPATEEVLGEVTDASRADMHRAIDAAAARLRRDDWSTEPRVSKAGLQQLQEALESEREELRELLILEVGCPRMVTHGPQLDAPLAGALTYPGQADRRVSVGDGPRRRDGGPHRPARRAAGSGASRSGSWPRSCPGTTRSRSRSTSSGRRSPPATRSSSSRHPTRRTTRHRLGRLIAEHTDIPAGVVNVVHAVRPPRRRGAHALAEGRPDLLHRLDSRRQAHHGEGRGDHEAAVP